MGNEGAYFQTKLIPYFGKPKMCNITAQQIITWKNELINYKDENGKQYSPVYLKTIHNQLSAIFNRVGHESIEITYNYAHLFPSKQAEMADKLDMERGE